MFTDSTQLPVLCRVTCDLALERLKLCRCVLTLRPCRSHCHAALGVSWGACNLGVLCTASRLSLPPCPYVGALALLPLQRSLPPGTVEATCGPHLNHLSALQRCQDPLARETSRSKHVKPELPGKFREYQG